MEGNRNEVDYVDNENMLGEKNDFFHKRIFCTDFIQIFGYSEPSSVNIIRQVYVKLNIIKKVDMMDLVRPGWACWPKFPPIGLY